MTKQKIIISIIATILTFIVVRELLRLMIGDFAYSIIPGWHSTILPPQTTLTVLTILLLIMTLVILGLYKLIFNAFLSLWIKLKK